MSSFGQTIIDLKNTLPPLPTIEDPLATTYFTYKIQLDARSEVWIPADKTFDVTDASGTAHSLTQTFFKIEEDHWRWSIASDDEDDVTHNGRGELYFDKRGRLLKPQADISIIFNWVNGTQQTILWKIHYHSNLAVDEITSDITQLIEPTLLGTVTHDGVGGTAGKLSEAWQAKISRGGSSISSVRSSLTECGVTYVDGMLPDYVRPAKYAVDVAITGNDLLTAANTVSNYAAVVSKVQAQIVAMQARAATGLAGVQSSLSGLTPRQNKIFGTDLKKNLAGVTTASQEADALTKNLVKYS